jgi:uncharacterized membrane protein
MFLFLRVLHIITGVFWAGTMFFLVSFLMPAFRAVGPDAAKVFAELRARRMFVWTPVLAFITVVAGFWLYMLRMGAAADWARTREAMFLGGGGVSALVALILGVFVMRASTLKADDLSRAAGPMAPGAERDAQMAIAQKLRARAMMSARGIATLLLITVVAMAMARYMTG